RFPVCGWFPGWIEAIAAIIRTRKFGLIRRIHPQPETPISERFLMPHTVQLQIGINGAFLTRRWEEPENWMRLTRECGFTVHSFCGDVIDPFFSGDRAFQQEQAKAAKAAAQAHGITICDFYTGVATHRFHGLSH